jgi:hypothetical protein
MVVLDTRERGTSISSIHLSTNILLEVRNDMFCQMFHSRLIVQKGIGEFPYSV